ncbi:hypothetical protein STEG23_013518 [Scotinomys teguina]
MDETRGPNREVSLCTVKGKSPDPRFDQLNIFSCKCNYPYTCALRLGVKNEAKIMAINSCEIKPISGQIFDLQAVVSCCVGDWDLNQGPFGRAVNAVNH